MEREVKETERLVELDEALPAVLCGLLAPSGADELAGYARLCSYKRLYAASAHLYQKAFADRPALADDPGPAHRYHAARAAALAGSGEGCDAAGLDARGRALWRARALAWLRADLAVWEGRPGQAAGTRMQAWQRDPDLAALRELDRLAELPGAEAKSCLLFWAEVRALQVRCRVTPARAGVPGSLRQPLQVPRELRVVPVPVLPE